jgi:hypothetical protein
MFHAFTADEPQIDFVIGSNAAQGVGDSLLREGRHNTGASEGGGGLADEFAAGSRHTFRFNTLEKA